MKRFLKVVGIILLCLLLLSGGLTLSLRIPAVQNYLAQSAVNYLSKKLGTRVSIKSFEWSLFKNIDLKGFYLADCKGDTLIYAGKLNAEISYWSLFKKQVVINGITLTDAKVHLQNDTAGHLNLTALFDALRDTALQKKADTSSNPMVMSVDLKTLSLVNTDFKFDDLKKHLLVSVFVPSCNIDVNKLALAKKLVDIHTIALDGVRAMVTVEPKDENLPPPPSETFRFLPPGWQVRWDGITISNSQFAYNDFNKPEKQNIVDFAHLALNDINLKARKGNIFRDSIDADVKLLTAREKSGFEVKKLGGLATVSINEISLRNLQLETGNSKLNAYLSFKYSEFEDFNHFADSVTIKADLHNAVVSLKDLNYLFNNIGPVAHNTINISGTIKGKLKELQGKNIALSTATGTYLKCNFFASGLPDIEETSLNLRIDQLVTTAGDLHIIYPSNLYPPNLYSLGQIRFSGDFDGFISDFVTRGNLVTDIGSARSDINFKYNKRDGKSAYSGDLSMTDFDMGKWFADPATYGKVSLHTSIEGTGIKPETLNAKLVGDVADLTLKGYDYKDLKVDGTVKGKFFSGNLLVKDQYLNADFTGTVDLTDKIPRYNFAATVRNANLKQLHLTKDTFDLSGDVTADFSGRKPDDMVGSVILNNLFMRHGHESVLVQNVVATSNILDDNRKEIKLRTDNVEGEITGRFSFSGLPKAMLSYFNYTFTKNYQDTLPIEPQQFNFEVRIFDSSALTRVIDPRFKEIRNTTVSGELNTLNHVLNVHGVIPELVFDKYTVKQFELDAKSENGKLDLLAGADRIYVSDSVLVDTFVSHTYTAGDELRSDLLAFDAKKYNRANITAYIKPLQSGAEVRFMPSEVWLGGNKWSFAPENRIVIRGNKITTDSLIFASGSQSIRMDAYLKNDTSTSIDVLMNETSLGDFVNIFNNKVKDIKGVVNGSLKVEDIFTNPAPIGNIEIRDLYLGKIPVGIMKVNTTLDKVQKMVMVEGTLYGNKTDLAIKGYYDLQSNEISLSNEASTINLNFLNHPIFDKYVRRVTGTASILLNLHGPINALDLKGTVRINEAKVNVTYINTTYSLRNEDIEVNDGYFDIGTIDVIDSFNNRAYGTGRIYHDHFKKVTLDLHVNTDNMQVLNTTAKEMPVFYGNGMAKGKVDFTGTIPAVTIRVYAQVKAGTHCAIPINNTYETGRYSFYRFVNPLKDTVKVKRKEDIKVKGVNFILDLDVTPDGVLDIILDPATGDILSSRGRGEIKLELLRSGEFNIYGRYEIDQGNYLFTMQNIINKKFELDNGGTITFKGDINNAQLDIGALYKVKTSTYDLISDLLAANGQVGSDADLRSRNRINVDLLLKLKGVLQSPDISFDIRPVDPDPSVRTYVDNKMQVMRATESEMNKQVFGLLVMNRFLPSGNSTTDAIVSSRSIGNSATNTVSEFLSSQLSMYMGSFFDNLNVKDLDLNLNFQSYDQTSVVPQTADNLNSRKEVQLALTKKFFNNRLSVNVGGNLDFGDNYQSVSGNAVSNNKSTYATGDFEVEYILDKNGTWRAKTYNRNDYDNFNNRNINKTGIGISFRKDFDRWIDLFKRRAKKPKPQDVPKPNQGKPEDQPKAQSK